MIIVGNSNVSSFRGQHLSISETDQEIAAIWVGALKIEHFLNGHPAGTRLREMFGGHDDWKMLCIGTHDIVDLCAAADKGSFQETFEQTFADYRCVFQELNKLGKFAWLVFPQAPHQIEFDCLTPDQVLEISRYFNGTLEEWCHRNEIPTINPLQEILGPDGRPYPHFLQKDEIHLNSRAAELYLREIGTLSGSTLEFRAKAPQFEPENEVESFCSLLLGGLGIPFEENSLPPGLEEKLSTFATGLLEKKGLEYDVEPDTELVDSGLMDSLNLVELFTHALEISGMELTFDVELRSLDTVRKINDFIVSRSNQHAGNRPALAFSDFLVSARGNFDELDQRNTILEAERRIGDMDEHLTRFFIEQFGIATGNMFCNYGIVFLWLGLLAAKQKRLGTAIKLLSQAYSNEIAFPLTDSRKQYYRQIWTDLPCAELCPKEILDGRKYKITPVTSSPRKKISVVTPSYNQAGYLEECIDSILSQNYPNIEYIIMDGGSTDGSVEIIRKYEKYLAHWQSTPDDGQYAAIHAGFSRSTGEIMTWINSDDKFHPHSFTKVSDIFSSYPQADWIMGRPNGFDESGKLSWIFDYLPRWSREKYLKKEYKNPFIQQEGTFWNRSLWDKAGGYLQTDLKLAGDLELWARFFRHARLYTVDALLAGLRTHPGQKTASLLEEYCLEAERILDREIQFFQQQEQKELLPSPEPLSVRSIVSDDSIKGKQFLVSAIVSTYNSEKFIRGCLEDLVNQTLFHKGQLEVVIVDSGSLQGEKFIVEEFRINHPTIRYLRTEERETIYEAWNRAIKSSTGKYLTNANTDDRHRNDALEVLAAELDRDPELALVYADQIVTERENETFSQCTPVGYFAWPEFDRTQLIHCSCVGPQPMWRRSLHDELGLFNEDLKVAGDYDWWLRISESYRIKHIPALLGLYLMNQSGLEIANPGICDSETLALRKSATEKAGITLDYDAYASCFLVPVYPESKVSPLVSVIVPTHNRPELLAKALRSVLDQTFRDFEIIVVNDAGIDVSRLVEHFNSMGTIHYINKKTNEGVAAARNSAIRAARGKYIAYLDDDDTYYPDHLQTLTDYLENSDSQVVYSDAHRALQEQKGEIFTTVKQDIPYSEEFDTDRLLVENYIPVLCVMHEKQCLAQVGLFDETLPRHEDWDLWIRLSQKFPFVHIPKITAEFTHRINDPSGMTSGTLPSMLVTLERIYEKSAPLAGSRPLVIARRKSYLFDLKSRIHGFLQDKLEAISDCLESDTELRETEIIAQLRKTGANRKQILAANYHKLGLQHISGDPATALSYFSRALAADPVCCPVHRSIAETLLRIGETEKAVRHCEVIISQEPNDPELIDMVASMTRRLGNRDKAVFWEEKARTLRRTMHAA